MLSEPSASFCSFLRLQKPPILKQKSLWAGIFQVLCKYTAEVGHGPIPLHNCHLDEVPVFFHPLEQIRLCETQKEGNSWCFSSTSYKDAHACWIAVTRTPSPCHKTTSLCSLCICSFLPQQHCLSRASSIISWEIYLHNSLFLTNVVQICPIQYIALYCHYTM